MAGDGAREEVLLHMRTVEKESSVRILYACEGGSRAQGMNHSKSDYDVRFIFVRRDTAFVPLGTYRSKGDVITPKVGNRVGNDADIWDLSGWDLRKALVCTRECNPTLLEWLFSPVVYLEVGDSVESMRDVVRRHFNARLNLHHYFSWIKSSYKKFLKVKGNQQGVPLKKLLILMRLLCALRWLEKPNPGVIALDYVQLATVALDGVGTRILDNVMILADSRRVHGRSVVPESEAVRNIYKFIRQEYARFEERDKEFRGDQVEKAPFDELDVTFRSALESV